MDNMSLQQVTSEEYLVVTSLGNTGTNDSSKLGVVSIGVVQLSTSATGVDKGIQLIFVGGCG